MMSAEVKIFNPSSTGQFINDELQVRERILRNYQNKKHFRQNIYISDERHFVYVKNHKAACTTILGSLALNFANEQKETVSFETVEEVHFGAIPFLERVRIGKDIGLALDCLQSPDYFHFTFLRDPISRTLSAYADKLTRPSVIRANLRDHLGLSAEDPKISLQDFIYALRDDPSVLDFNRHWRPQVKEVSYHEVDYQYIGVVDRLGDELRAVMKLLFPLNKRPKIYNSRTKLNHRTNSQKLHERLSGEELRILEKIYEEDFDAYNQALLKPSKIQL